MPSPCYVLHSRPPATPAPPPRQQRRPRRRQPASPRPTENAGSADRRAGRGCEFAAGEPGRFTILKMSYCYFDGIYDTICLKLADRYTVPISNNDLTRILFNIVDHGTTLVTA
jgi:hypothetical protein